MAIINFPSSPALDELYTFESRTWKWNGSGWVVISGLAAQAAETILANATAGSAAPTALSIAEQTLLGRITGGHIDDLTPAQVRTLLDLANIYQPVAVNYAPTVITFGNAATEYDINGTTWVASTAGIPDVAGHLVAAALTAIATPYDSTYLAIREHSGAASATNPLTVQFTFPSVITFNVVKFRCRYTGSAAHEIVYELYNGATWDIFDTFTSTADYQLHSLEVLVPASYVIASTVLGRFRHLDAGVTTHTLLIDFVIIGSGGGSGGDSIQSAHQTPFDPAGSIVATNVQAAVEELDAKSGSKSAQRSWFL